MLNFQTVYLIYFYEEVFETVIIFFLEWPFTKFAKSIYLNRLLQSYTIQNVSCNNFVSLTRQWWCIWCPICFPARVAFRVNGLYPSASSSIRFKSVQLNIGGDYSDTTGIFTCSVPGLYWFSAALAKNANVNVGSSRLFCYIKWNGSNKIAMYASPVDQDKDGISISVSVPLNLSRGDKVQIGSCDSGSIFGNLDSTYFSGVLVRPDNCLWGPIRSCVWSVHTFSLYIDSSQRVLSLKVQFIVL